MADVFQRHELKYLVSAEQRAALEAAMEPHLVPDEHGESTICNIYYDTPDFRLIRRSLERPEYKEKLRLRSYGQVEDGTDVFLELKKKAMGVVYKRRILVDAKETERRLANGEKLDDDSQIGREIEAFRRFYGDLEPKVVLCYDRTAWFDKESRDLRLTFDRNIRFRTEMLSLTDPTEGTQILAPGQSLLEIKASRAMPMWLAGALSAGQVRQVSFSKYGRAYQLLANKAHISETEEEL